MAKRLPVLYVFVRTDLPSMTPGKAQAHSGHASNAFVFKNYISKVRAGKKAPDAVAEWMAETPFGFGTQINLKAPWEETLKVVATVIESGKGVGEIIVDNTYPYIADGEVVRFIDSKVHTEIPFDLEDGRFLCHRSEMTAAYVFGYKDDLEQFVGKYPLHP